MFARASVAFLLALLMAVPVSAQTVGQKVSGDITLPTNIQSKLYVPLPKGNWQVIATGSRLSSVSNVKIPKIYLAQVRAKKLVGYIRIEFNREPPDYGWGAPKDCTRANIFFLTPDASTFYNPTRGYNCLSINHVGMTTGRNVSQSTRDAYSWVWKNTTGMPRFMIRATFSVADGTQFIQVRYYRNHSKYILRPFSLRDGNNIGLYFGNSRRQQSKMRFQGFPDRYIPVEVSRLKRDRILTLGGLERKPGIQVLEL